MRHGARASAAAFAGSTSGLVGDDRIDCRNEFTQLHYGRDRNAPGRLGALCPHARALDDGCDDLVLDPARRAARCRSRREARRSKMTRGQMCLTEMNVVGTADLTRSGGFTTARFPRRPAAAGRAVSGDAARTRRSDASRALERDDRALFGAAARSWPADLDAAGQQAAAHHLGRSRRSCPGHGPEKKELIAQSGPSKARLDLLKAHILTRSRQWRPHDRGASPGRNALSTRQAQRLFASARTTFSDFVLEQRRLLARRMLLHEQSAGRKVSDVAYTVGFNDLSYFHRAFRRKFGVAPSEMQMEFGRKH